MTHPANRLASEKSPYLLQHQHNPVDWYPWGPEAFAKAQADSLPVFLSIGYSTCHWCHVMERESFEDPNLASYLNQHFVSIKVDREERPDIDKIYMTFVQATTGAGGWPLSAFLTPDLKPFFGSTYFPPEDRHGRPAFLKVLQQIHQLWTDRRTELQDSANEVHLRLETSASTIPAAADLTPQPLAVAAAQSKAEYDPQHGGFGSAPKFPRPSQPAQLLRHAVRHNDPEAIQMVLHTCERMAAGGIHDQLGGGFHRYAVDDHWLVPHFEKMLYDNAQLIDLYLDAALVSNNPAHAETARTIVHYVLREMTHPAGGFYSAQDADSEGQEGKFFCWTRRELTTLLSPEQFNVATRHFGITETGNFLDHSHPNPLPGLNVLHIADPRIPASDAPILQTARRKMFATREQRIRPHLDDKILASWNGLMLGAIARAAAVLGDDSFRTAALRNLDFIRTHLWDPQTRTLHHRWRDGERDATQLLTAYAFLLSGTLTVYETTLLPQPLEFAISLADAMIERFEDSDQGAFFQSAASEDLILRLKEDYDGAEPSGNSVAALALLRLAAITGQSRYRQSAERTLRYFITRMDQAPQTVPLLLLALDFWLDEPRRVVITGDPESPATRHLLTAAHSVYQPNKVVLGTRPPVPALAIPLPADGSPCALICTQSSCQPPTADPQTIRTLLRS